MTEEEKLKIASAALAEHLGAVCSVLKCMRVSSDPWQRVLERSIEDLASIAAEVSAGKKVLHVPQYLHATLNSAVSTANLTGDIAASTLIGETK